MLSNEIELALNQQLKVEAASSHLYLAWASWAESTGFPGVAQFMYAHSDEERQHMLKLLHYINERGGKAIIPELEKPNIRFSSISDLFKNLLKHEKAVTSSINQVVGLCLKEQDYSTHNFMQWYVSEQLEKESLATDLLDKLNMIGDDKSGMYMFDRDIMNFRAPQ